MTEQRLKLKPVPSSQLTRVAIVCSRYNDWITDPLLEGAISEYQRRRGSESGLVVIEASGSFEVPVLVRHAAVGGQFDAVVALGCIIKGETSHDLHLATSVSNALMDISRETGVPVGFGILTVDTVEQAEARAGGAKGNKGVEAMAAALDSWAMIKALKELSGARTQRGNY